MSDQRMNKLLANARRRGRIGSIVVGLVFAAPVWIGTIWFDFPTIPTMIIVVFLALGVKAIPCYVTQNIKLATDKSPEDVRSELLRDGLALSPFDRERADKIEHLENGIKVTVDHPIFSSQSYTLETEARPDGSIAIYRDHTDEPTIIDIISDQERTIILEDVSATRAGLVAIWQEWFLKSSYKDKALQLRGYEVIEKKTEYSIL